MTHKLSISSNTQAMPLQRASLISSLKPSNSQGASLLPSLAERTWSSIGTLAELMGETDKALFAYESSLKFSAANENTLTKLSILYGKLKKYPSMVEILQRMITNQPSDGYLWLDLARCYLFLNEHEKAYVTLQHALPLFTSLEDSYIWFTIGLLYEKYGQDEHAEEAYLNALSFFEQTRKSDSSLGSYPNPSSPYSAKVILREPRKSFSFSINACYYRLGLIYSRRPECVETALSCFRYLLSQVGGQDDEPSIMSCLIQTAILLERKGDLIEAHHIAIYLNGKYPKSAAVCRLLGWIYMRELECFFTKSKFERRKQESSIPTSEDPRAPPGETSQVAQEATELVDQERLGDLAVNALLMAVEYEASDSHSWYLLGRLYCLRGWHQRAYEAYQQAIYRDSKQPSYWCSVGVLYFKIGQYKDSLNGFIRSIHLNSKIPQIWANLGILYEHCHNQVKDAVEAYVKAVALDPNFTEIQNRIKYLMALEDSEKNITNPNESTSHAGCNLIPELKELNGIILSPAISNFPMSTSQSPSTSLAPASLLNKAMTQKKNPNIIVGSMNPFCGNRSSSFVTSNQLMPNKSPVPVQSANKSISAVVAMTRPRQGSYSNEMDARTRLSVLSENTQHDANSRPKHEQSIDVVSPQSDKAVSHVSTSRSSIDLLAEFASNSQSLSLS